MRPKINFSRSIKCLLHDARLTRTSLESQIARLDRIELDLVTLERICSPDAAKLKPVAGMSGGAAVHSICIKPCANGCFQVSINGGAGELALPPVPGAVFAWLASKDASRTPDDPDAGWVTRSKIKSFLEALSGHPCRPAYVNQVLHLLRNRFRRQGFSADVIESNRRRGARVLPCNRSPETLA